ncbi:DDE family transposase [Salipiger aestuarii]|uniref:DDE family transposase n=1 Tax=Salipiger aestuarii TaxID=568098 RepID=A0A327YSN1_9RHOB|nr:DDE family transposase [Salipiger aestuarii]
MIWEAAPTGRRGRQPDYSDAAIQTCLTMKVLFGMALRQTTGFVESVLKSGTAQSKPINTAGSRDGSRP